MGYTSQSGRRPSEFASKSSHSHIVNDPDVAAFLSTCKLPDYTQDIELAFQDVANLDDSVKNPIKHIITIDGGLTPIPVRKEFPSSEIAFFQLGALIFSVADLEDIHQKRFIEPSDMEKLRQIQRLKLTLPIKNISLNSEATLINSVRKAIYNFFTLQPKDDQFIKTLSWFLFEEYSGGNKGWSLASCPNECEEKDIPLRKEDMNSDYIFKCPKCGGDIYLTDVFRLHEAIDNEVGAGGVLGYVTTLLEQVLLVHLIRVILQTKAHLLNEILFIKDGPLAFFGQTANMYKPMRKLVNFLFDKHNLYLVGLEKSGAFVEHAAQIASKLEPGTFLMPNNDYIYRYIIPGRADPGNPYGSTTYYGNKIIFKAQDEKVYVAIIPTRTTLSKPAKSDFPNLDAILLNIQKLKCDMYDSALVPVTLVNHLVSLSNHPSSVILEKFAKGNLG